MSQRILLLLLCLSVCASAGACVSVDGQAQETAAPGAAVHTPAVQDEAAGQAPVSDVSTWDYTENHNGIRVEIETAKESYQVGESIVVSMKMRNDGTQTGIVAGNADAPSLLLNEPVVYLLITAEGTLECCEYVNGSYPVGCAGRLYQFEVKPNAEFTAEYEIQVDATGQLLKGEDKKYAYRLTPGAYRLQLEYYGIPEYILLSKPLHIQITPPQPTHATE